MRLVRFQDPDASTESWGVSTSEGIRDFGSALKSCPTMMDAIAQWDSLSGKLPELMAEITLASTDIKILSPVPAGGKVLCIGLNYRDHAIETGADIPTEPVVFNKLDGALCNPGEPIILPKVSSQVDFEAEMVVVMGRETHCVSRDEALEAVFGYCCGHDVSARDWQKGRPGGQWLLGKSFPNFAPLGPFLVPKAHVEDPNSLRVCMRINGETYQDSTTSQLIFKPDELIEYLSQCFVLKPGDVIFTGTPPGVGAARNPPRFLTDGDSCEVEVEGLGVLANPVTQQR